MPLTTNYTPILPLISQSRLDSFNVTFKATSAFDLYGVYIWAQHASASLYPLVQNLEITLRNTIDIEAKRRFGDYWWDHISVRHPQAYQVQKFRNNIEKAKSSLHKNWARKERLRLGLPSHIPIRTAVPVWTHDQIVAATDFSTWQYILADSFRSPGRTQTQTYLWPISVGRVFKNFSIINTDQDLVRKDLMNLISELREYRNRLFHHEPLWIKAPTVIDGKSAIVTIQNKINKIELMISAIDTRKLDILNKVGLFSHAKRICSENELSIYRYVKSQTSITKKSQKILRPFAQKTKLSNETITYKISNEIFGFYKIR